MKLVQLVFILAFGIWLSSCGTATPEEAAARTIQTVPLEQRLNVTKSAPEGVLILWRSRNPIGDRVEIGYGHVKQTLLGWQTQQALGTEANLGIAVPELDEPVPFYFSSPDNPNDATIVFGFAQDERVTQMRVTFSDRATKSDDAELRMFGIMTAPKFAPCEIELRDAQDNLLYRYSLHQDPDEFVFDDEIIKWAKRECK